MRQQVAKVIYKDRQSGTWIYWIDNVDIGGRTYLNEVALSKLLRQGYRIVELCR